LEYRFNKGCTLIAIGGGIIQDIAAFVGKIFKRGIDWIYVPTTLLSQCDSCIGGKTALNFQNFKNQLALFSSPSQVIIDTNFIDTLTDKEIVSGYGEIIKLFLIGGNYYINNLTIFDLETIIFHTLSIKKAVIEHDEFDSCERKSLNYGHSFGHAIEAMTNYKVSHGEAVLFGIELINKLFTDSKDITNIVNSKINFDQIKNLPNKINIIDYLKTDKKVSNNSISFVVVTEPGNTSFKETKLDQQLADKIHEILID
jgi:3-dehydroquinate synthase